MRDPRGQTVKAAIMPECSSEWGSSSLRDRHENSERQAIGIVAQKVRALAQQEGISINQFVSTAVAEKMAALMTVDYLEEKAKRGSREKFLAVLAKVPDVAPEPGDEL
jgi:hypothetical protein